jgi:hypothetical protein
MAAACQWQKQLQPIGMNMIAIVLRHSLLGSFIMLLTWTACTTKIRYVARSFLHIDLTVFEESFGESKYPFFAKGVIATNHSQNSSLQTLSATRIIVEFKDGKS